MKNKIIFILTMGMLLGGCGTPSTDSKQEEPKEEMSQEEVQKEEELKVLGETTSKIEEMNKMYSNPKRATVKRNDNSKAGMIYMQHDKDNDKTYVWAELDSLTEEERGNEFMVKLADDKADTEVEIGEVVFDKGSQGKFYFEFQENGNYYNYLRAVFLVDKEETLYAIFNPRLN